MESWLENLLSQLTSTPWYYLLILVIATCEGITLVGLLVPGSALCIAIGALAASGHGQLELSCAAAAIGALCGDLISYLLGARFGPPLAQSVFPSRSKPLLRRAQLFFTAHGGKSLVFARFFGPLRGLVPFVAGSVHFPAATLASYTLLASIAWGISYPLMGYVGLKSWQQIPFLHVGKSLFFLTGLCIIVVLAIRLTRHRNRPK
mgnify:FL=1